MNAETIGKLADSVKMIATFSVGYEHVDVAAAAKRGIKVSNTPDVLTDATADIAMTLILMATRRAGEGERELRAGEWTGWRPTHLLGRSLRGKVLGLVGYGRIARAVADRAKAFGMKIAVHSRSRAEDVPEANYHASLQSLLSIADVVSLHAPGGAATRRMIDAAALSAMKRDAVLVNTGRGTLIDEAALAFDHAFRPGEAFLREVHRHERAMRGRGKAEVLGERIGFLVGVEDAEDHARGGRDADCVHHLLFGQAQQQAGDDRHDDGAA